MGVLPGHSDMYARAAPASIIVPYNCPFQSFQKFTLSPLSSKSIPNVHCTASFLYHSSVLTCLRSDIMYYIPKHCMHMFICHEIISSCFRRCKVAGHTNITLSSKSEGKSYIPSQSKYFPRSMYIQLDNVC